MKGFIVSQNMNNKMNRLSFCEIKYFYKNLKYQLNFGFKCYLINNVDVKLKLIFNNMKFIFITYNIFNKIIKSVSHQKKIY